MNSCREPLLVVAAMGLTLSLSMLAHAQGPADVAATTPPTTADAIRPPSCSVKNYSQTQQGPTLPQDGGIYEGEICGSCGFGVRAS